MTSFDDRDLVALVSDLSMVTARTHPAVRGVIREGAHDLRDDWRANAKESAGRHGRLYPLAITAEEKISTQVEFEIGPETNKPQGGMSFEYGSVNQPPHLDGQRAADKLIPLIERRISVVTEGLF